MGRRLLTVAASIGVLGVAGCGSSNAPDPVARAASVTGGVPGYRMAATMTVTNPAVGPVTMSMSGSFDRADRSGAMVAEETLPGRRLRFTEVFSGLTFYLQAGDLPQLTKLAGGKHWLKFDMSRMLGAMGLGSLPVGGTDPSQFVDFLRAVSSSTKRVGTESIRGVGTTHYHATIDLDRYPSLVASAQQATAKRSVATLESVLGGHTMPMDAWIDRRNLVRRIALGFPECIAGLHLRVAMAMDLYGYGPQSAPRIPPVGDTYDLTPLLSTVLGKIKLGCGAA